MIVYRIAKKKWIEDLSGIGAKLAGGRWNSKGIPVLYCASTSSLAILEKLVSVDFDLLPNDLYIGEIDVPETDILTISVDQLPKNWNEYPSPDELKRIGGEWIAKNEHLILEVPSAVNPHESNFVLNVNHKFFHKIKIRRTFPVFFDGRLKK
jgi:RES domain-containing protein